MNELEELQRELAASVRFEVPEHAQVLDTGEDYHVVWWDDSEPRPVFNGSQEPA